MHTAKLYMVNISTSACMVTEVSRFIEWVGSIEFQEDKTSDLTFFIIIVQKSHMASKS